MTRKKPGPKPGQRMHREPYSSYNYATGKGSRPWSNGIVGRECRLHADEIAALRSIYDRLAELRRERRELCRRLGITTDYASNVGRGAIGKKPKRRAQPDLFDEGAA